MDFSLGTQTGKEGVLPWLDPYLDNAGYWLVDMAGREVRESGEEGDAAGGGMAVLCGYVSVLYPNAVKLSLSFPGDVRAQGRCWMIFGSLMSSVAIRNGAWSISNITTLRIEVWRGLPLE